MSRQVKIFVSAHKPCYEVENGVFVPARQSEIVRALMQGGEEDVFMAQRADEFCELLTQYYAWKREKADWYGFAHYRRYFSFAKRAGGKPVVRCSYLNARTAAQFGLTEEERVRGIVCRCDVLTPVPLNYYIKSVYWQYEHGEFLHKEDLDAVLNIIKEDYPDYFSSAEKYLSGRYLYPCNMFAMKRELFCEYSEWLFGILKKFYAVRDMRALGYSAAERRAPGHLGERLFGVWLTHLRGRAGAKISRLPIVLFGDTSPRESLAPAFAEGVPVFLHADGQSAPLSAVSFSSLLAHADAGRRYDVVAFGEGLSAQDREKFLQMAQGRDNVSLRFLDCGAVMAEAGFASRSRRERELFSLFSLPLRTQGFGRVLVLERGAFLRTDAARLWDAARTENGAVCRAEGVCVLDLSVLGAAYDGQKLCSAFAGRREMSSLVRALCGENVSSMPAVGAGDGPVFLRFGGKEVPWKDKSCAFAREFSEAAQRTPYAREVFLCDRRGRTKQKKTLFDRLFPQGSRRRSAWIKLFRR